MEQVLSIPARLDRMSDLDEQIHSIQGEIDTHKAYIIAEELQAQLPEDNVKVTLWWNCGHHDTPTLEVILDPDCEIEFEFSIDLDKAWECKIELWSEGIRQMPIPELARLILEVK